MDSSLDLDENLNRFTKLSQDLANCDEKLSQDQLAVVLLNSISDRHKDLKNALEYGRDNLTTDIIISALKNRDLEIKSENRENLRGETLIVKGKNFNKSNFHQKGNQTEGKRKVQNKEKIKNNPKGKKCYFCGKTGHFIKDCFKRQNELKEKGTKEGTAVLAYENESENGWKTGKTSLFKGKLTNLKEFLITLHADLWGPATVCTQSGFRYYLLIIDDFSRKSWVFLLKTKDETFSAFKNWKTQIENQVDLKIKTLRTDNGLELCNYEFNEFCNIHGIIRHRTVTYTPQQNGVAERMNRTLLNKVRCMLLSSGLPKLFWGETVVTAVYLCNRSPSSALNFKVLESVWSKRPVDYSHLKIFGCAAYAHQNIGKLEPRSLKCVLLGYGENTKGYRLWVKEERGFNVIVRRDVVFNESLMPCLKDTTSTLNERDISFEVESSNLEHSEDVGEREDINHQEITLQNDEESTENNS
ncbi:Integrase catalytic domain-containing protein [Abeliophyllum distichum]|uniref:Integrase catalytic domain-containing protein n=1 Tax=Abeliophyllum distichum TaxID=126358 RepID=A0ABD1RY45_9LAMI